MPDTVIALQEASVRAARGTVFGPLSTQSSSPITVVVGDRGSGRTSLLLSLSGRMRLSSGSVEVLGIDAGTRSGLAQIRTRTGVAGFEAVDSLEPSVTVCDTLRERLAWAMPWWRRTPRLTPERSNELLAETFGDLPLPAPDMLVRELDPASEMLLRISLARIERPELLCIDDFDALRSPAERERVAQRLDALAAHGVRLVVATSDPSDVEMLSHTAIINL